MSAAGWVVRRCRRWCGGGFDYRIAYRKADLDRDHWSIVGPTSQEEFEALGRGKRQMLIGAGLTPQGRVLDVGCGTGQLTEALFDYLSPEGLYHGTDIAPQAVAFCQKKFRRPNFFFHQNEMTRLPLADVQFDIVYFGSVFTHMYPQEIGALLTDARRLLGVSGLIIADAFVASEVDPFGGDRGMVVINEAHLLETFARTGLRYEVLHTWPWSPGVCRSIFQLSLAAECGRPVSCW